MRTDSSINVTRWAVKFLCLDAEYLEVWDGPKPLYLFRTRNEAREHAKTKSWWGNPDMRALGWHPPKVVKVRVRIEEIGK